AKAEPTPSHKPMAITMQTTKAAGILLLPSTDAQHKDLAVPLILCYDVSARGSPKWWNWQTRGPQKSLGFTPVWVRLPPSAPAQFKLKEPAEGSFLFHPEAPSPRGLVFMSESCFPHICGKRMPLGPPG